MTAPATVDARQFTSFAEFYPFYLSEHSNRTCRRLHFVGSTLALVCLAMLVITGKPQYLLYRLAVRLRLCLDRALRLREEQACQFQAPALQLHGRLGHVQGPLDRQDPLLTP